MFTELFWIEGPWRGRMAIAPRPRGGDWLEGELKAWRQSSIDAVVSLLEPGEVEDLGLEKERAYCEANGIAFYALPITDRSVPRSHKGAAHLLGTLERELNIGKSIVIHCRQGIGRAGLIAVTLLIEKGLSPAEAVKRVSAARHTAVPETPEQRAWIDSFAAALDEKR
jgi:protein-tyrosine phosphatase